MNLKKTVLVRGPALTQSGYGEHTRFVLRSLRKREDEFDIHILPTVWGETGWLLKAAKHLEAKIPYDMTVQVTIPNEWKPLAPLNVGVTAGIESNKLAPVWLEAANQMDKVIVVSEHSKNGFMSTVYKGQDAEGNTAELRCSVPVEVIGYPVKIFDEVPSLDLNLDFDFNYLAVAQWGPRKNLQNVIRWFVEENYDQEVGLIIKTSLKNNSIVDRGYAEILVKNSIPDLPDCKCKVYMLHGDMSESEIHALYRHPKVKAMVSLTHGEGFGLPLFEAAYSALPIIAPGWSGQADFLYTLPKTTSKKNKKKKKAMFADVDYTIGPVPPEAVWPGVIEKESMWCHPTEGSFKLRMRQLRKNYDKWLKKAQVLQSWVVEEFEYEKMHKKLSNAIYPEPSVEEREWLDKLSEVEIL